MKGLCSSTGELKSVIVFVVNVCISISVLYLSTSCFNLLISSSRAKISTSLAEFLNSCLDLNSKAVGLDMVLSILYFSKLFSILSSSSSKSGLSSFSSLKGAMDMRDDSFPPVGEKNTSEGVVGGHDITLILPGVSGTGAGVSACAQ